MAWVPARRGVNTTQKSKVVNATMHHPTMLNHLTTAGSSGEWKKVDEPIRVKIPSKRPRKKRFLNSASFCFARAFSKKIKIDMKMFQVQRLLEPPLEDLDLSCLMSCRNVRKTGFN